MGRIGLTKGNYYLQSADETFFFGKQMGLSLPKDAVLALTGNLGAGKTTFVQGLASGLGIKDRVQSPTFILLNLYEGLAHFDLYRLKSAADFTSLGFDEYLSSNCMCAIEWPERIENLLPLETIRIHFDYEKEGRVARIS